MGADERRELLKKEIEHLLVANSPLVLHFVKVSYISLFAVPRVALSAEQCEAIRDHQNDDYWDGFIER
jgi:hypothetical protein